MELVEDAFARACEATGTEPTEHVLRVRIGQQKLEHWAGGQLVEVFTISTGKREPSCRENSLGTPLGLHCVAEKIGHGQPLGMVFKARQPQGQCYWQLDEKEGAKNQVTTRILRLRGLEPGVNSGPGVDTFNRYVYIHGTNREDLLGQPATSGCPVLANEAMVRLFDAVPRGSLVWIAQ